MPLRSKPGQSRVVVVVQADDDPVEEAAGKATSRRVSSYYASAYYAAGASEGGGGKWCVATFDHRGLLPVAMQRLGQLGAAPGQEWTQERLEALLRGAGRRLGTIVKEDRLTGRRTKVQVAKTDTWVFDCPKSVSLLACYGFDDDGWLTSVIEDAARAGMEWLAMGTEYVRRRGADGEIERQRGSAIHYSLVLERTARPAEGPEDLTGLPAPHYHAHVLIHGAFDRDGKYGAYDASHALSDHHRQMASARADLVLRQRLADRGIAMRRVAAQEDEEDEQGSPAPPHWEVASIPDAAVRVASERRRAILAAMAEDPQGGRSFTELGAEFRTKAKKSGVNDWPALLRMWRRLIEVVGARAPRAHRPPPGVTWGSVGAGLVEGQTEKPSEEELARLATRVLRRFASTRSHFDLTELRAEIVQELDGTWERQTAPVLMSLLSAQWAASGQLIALHRGRVTFRDVLRQELRTLRRWQRLSADVDDDLSALAPAAVAAHQQESGHQLDDGQRRLVEEALRRRAVIGLGVAGVGKTAAGDALRRAAAVAGRQVHSVAMACLRARDTGTQIAATRDESVQAVLSALQRPDGLEVNYRPGDFLLVDEVSQIADVALEGLLTAADRMRLHLVMLGDTAQQGPIARGAMAAEIMRRGGDAVIEMQVAHRFRDPVQAEALGKMHDGDAMPWIRYAHERGWLRSFSREAESTAEILRLWQEDRGRLVVTLGDNVRRDDLNTLIVGDLVARGEVSAARTVEVRADVKSPRRVELHEGQSIRLNRQIRQEVAPGRWEKVAKNGETARLETIVPGRVPEETRLRLHFDEGTSEARTVDVEVDRVIATGAYARQAYKTQGATAERVVVDWADGRRRQQVYPTLSRQREECVVVGTARDEADRIAGPSALTDRIVESIVRQGLSTPACSLPRAERWPDQLVVDAYREKVTLPRSPRDVDLWSDAPPPIAAKPDVETPRSIEATRTVEPSPAPGVERDRETDQTPRVAPPEPEPSVLQQVLDQQRITAALRGELDASQLSLAELSEAFAQQGWLQSTRPRLEELPRVEVHREDRLLPAERAFSREPSPPPASLAPSAPATLPRDLLRDPNRPSGELRIELGECRPEPAWQATSAQLPGLERAQQAWPEVLERKVAVMEHAVQQQLPATLVEVEREDRAAALRDHFQSHLAEEWGKVASDHRVTGAAMPALDRDLLARHGLTELLLPAEPVSELAPAAATPEAEPEARLERDELEVQADYSAGIRGPAEAEPASDHDDVGTVEGREDPIAAVSGPERQAVPDLEDGRAATPQVEPERADIGRAEAERDAERAEEEASAAAAARALEAPRVEEEADAERATAEAQRPSEPEIDPEVERLWGAWEEIGHRRQHEPEPEPERPADREPDAEPDRDRQAELDREADYWRQEIEIQEAQAQAELDMEMDGP